MRLRSPACALLALLVHVPQANAGLELVTRRDPGFPPSDAAGASPGGSTSISADGRYAAFVSTAPNLIAGQEDGNKNTFEGDVFLRDMVAGTTVLVSRSASSPSRTGNGGHDDRRRRELGRSPDQRRRQGAARPRSPARPAW